MLVQVRAQDNSGSGFLLYPGAGGGTALIADSTSLGNATGITVNGGQLYLGNSSIVRNNVGVAITSGTLSCPFMALPADSWGGRKRSFAPNFRTRQSRSRQLVKKRLRLPQIDGVEALGEPGARRSRASAILPWSRHKRGEVAGDTQFERAHPPRALQWRRSLCLGRDDALRCKFGMRAAS